MSLGWAHMFTAFMCGMFVATLILDLIYRLWRREADRLIATQRKYIGILERDLGILDEEEGTEQ